MMRRGGGSQGLLTRILEQGELVAMIQGLDSRVLARLINQVGLEDSGELVTLATTEQLQRIFDEDLWRSPRPGEAESFDAERFGLWLEVMLEMGAQAVAERLLEMDEDFLTLAFSRQVLVLDTDSLMSEGLDDLVEKAIESSLNQEIDHYWVISRDARSWDAVLTALLALDTEDHDFVTRTLERCAFFSSEYIENNGGLYEVLSSEEQLGSDVADSRERRRAREGYVAPETASAFLKLARGPLEAPDHLTPGYFRELELGARKPAGKVAAPASESVERERKLLKLLQEAEGTSFASATLLIEGPVSRIRQAFSELKEAEPSLFERRMAELSYLANVLMNGCSYEGRALRSAEAAEAVLGACNLALELEGAQGQSLRERDLIAWFRIGWSRLQQEVALPVAQALLRTLGLELGRRSDAWLREQLKGLSASLRRGLAGGAVWKALEELDWLEALWDAGIVCELRGYLDECPSVRGRFFSSVRDLREPRQFIAHHLADGSSGTPGAAR